MKCFWCETELEEVLASKYISTHWRCPECGGTWWPGEVEEQTEAEKLWNDEQFYKRLLAKKGGSSSKAKRKKVKKLASGIDAEEV